MAKYMMTIATITGGIWLRQSIRDLVEFETRFSLMNATLRAKLPSTLNYLRDEIMQLSSSTGKSIIDITDTMTQFFGAGLKPTAKEGTFAYQKQLNDAMKIQELLSNSALATGESTENMMEAYIYAANALGRDSKQFETARYIMSLFGSTLDQGIGWMKEYGTQFVKFTMEAKQAGLSDAEMFATFAKMTRVMTPEVAGFTMSAFMRGMNDLPRQAQRAALKVQDIMKSTNLTGDQRKLVRQFDTREEWENIFFATNEKGEKVKKSYRALMADLQKIVTVVPNNTALFDVLFQGLSNNRVAKRGMQLLLEDSGFTDLFGENGLVDLVDKDLLDGTIMMEKIAGMQESFGTKWTKMWAAVKTETLKVTHALSPALSAFASVVHSKLTGEGIDNKSLAAYFGNARAEIEKIAPSLEPVIDGIEKMTYYIASGQFKRELNYVKGFVGELYSLSIAMKEIFMGFWNSPPMVWLREKLQGQEVLSLALTLVGYNAAKHMLMGLGTLFGTSLLSGIIGSEMAGALLGKTWATNALGLMTTGGLAATKWGAVGKILTSASIWAVVAAIIAGGIKMYMEGRENKRDKAVEDQIASGELHTRVKMVSKGTIAGLQDDKLIGQLNESLDKKMDFNRVDYAGQQKLAQILAPGKLKYNIPREWNKLGIHKDMSEITGGDMSPNQLIDRYGEDMALSIIGTLKEYASSQYDTGLFSALTGQMVDEGTNLAVGTGVSELINSLKLLNDISLGNTSSVLKLQQAYDLFTGAISAGDMPKATEALKEFNKLKFYVDPYKNTDLITSLQESIAVQLNTTTTELNDVNNQLAGINFDSALSGKEPDKEAEALYEKQGKLQTMLDELNKTQSFFDTEDMGKLREATQLSNEELSNINLGIAGMKRAIETNKLSFTPTIQVTLNVDGKSMWSNADSPASANYTGPGGLYTPFADNNQILNANFTPAY